MSYGDCGLTRFEAVACGLLLERSGRRRFSVVVGEGLGERFSGDVSVDVDADDVLKFKRKFDAYGEGRTETVTPRLVVVLLVVWVLVNVF